MAGAMRRRMMVIVAGLVAVAIWPLGARAPVGAQVALSTDVSPSIRLVDGQDVTATAGGYIASTPGGSLVVPKAWQCVGLDLPTPVVVPLDPDLIDAVATEVAARCVDLGDFPPAGPPAQMAPTTTRAVTVRTTFTTHAGTEVSCGPSSGACTILVTGLVAGGFGLSSAPIAFRGLEDPRIAPFASAADAVARQVADLGAALSPEARSAWADAITEGSRTLEELVVQLHAVDLRGPGAEVTRLYLALLGRPPDTAGLAHWVSVREGGRSLTDVAAAFLRSPELVALHGSLDDGELVDLLYQSILGRSPSAVDRTFWVGRLAAGWSRPRVAVLFSESAEDRARTTIDLQVIDLVRAMLDRLPTTAEHHQAVDALRSGATTMTDVVGHIRRSDEYGDRVAAL